MKTFIILTLFLLLTSCGKDESSTSSTTQIQMHGLTKNEKKLREELIKKGLISQEELIKSLIKMEVGPDWFERMDLVLEVICQSQTQHCQIKERI